MRSSDGFRNRIWFDRLILLREKGHTGQKTPSIDGARCFLLEAESKTTGEREEPFDRFGSFFSS